MPLSAGDKLGPYEVLSPIGSGGMGEVYRARDTRLGRIVALKVSRTEFSERFEREARAIATLNHPHICTLHDVGPNYLVMEYIEGARLKPPLPIDQALKCAIQICDALDAAHRKGITHRDLKPANILITKTTGVKLLDFGLAKIEKVIDTSDATRTMELTSEGQILGTLYYMSPEQLQGRKAGPASDIFSFGLVFFEMLIGKRAFEGESPASVIAAILERPAPSVATVAPPALDRLLQRCLAKDPDDRWQSARDLRVELEWIAADAAKGSSSSAQTRAHRWKPIAWFAASIAMLAVIVLGIIVFGQSAPELPVTRLDIVTPSTSDPFGFALSPDGRQIVFAATSETGAKLWRRQLDQTTAQPLSGTDGAIAPFWAPDGRSIGFFADGKLKRLDMDGGLPQVLAAVTEGRGGAWSRDGVIVFAATSNGPLFRVAATGGPAVMMTRLDQTHHVSHRWPQILPDGRVMFFALGFAGDDPSGSYVAPLDGGPATRLAAAETAAAYAPPGYLLQVDQGILVARSINLKSGSVGNPVPIAQPVAADPNIWRAAFSVSATGVLVHRATTAARRQLVWVDRSGARLSAVGAIDENSQLTPSISPDGRRVAVQRTAQGAPHLWIFESGRDVATRFRDNSAPDARAVWSPDGLRIAFLSAMPRQQVLIEKPVTGGAAEERRLVSIGQGLSALDWSADNRFLLYSIANEKTGMDIWALRLTGEREAFPVVQSPFNEELGQLSHDGRWIAYQSNESGHVEVYIQPFTGTGGKLAVSSGGGIAPRWRRDGRELFYVAPDGAMMAVPLQASDGKMLEPGAPIRLFRQTIVGGGSMVTGGMQQYAVAPDGQRFLINMTIGEAGISPISVVLNWQAGLKK